MAASPATCPECGATVPEGGTCRDLFHALLLEAEVPGGPGRLPHFYAVASYGLQHAGGMNFPAEAAAGLRAALADVLDGRASLGTILHPSSSRGLLSPVAPTQTRADPARSSHPLPGGAR